MKEESLKAYRALLWKDWRMQLPLWYLLAGLMLMLGFILLLQSEHIRRGILETWLIPMGFPLFFAVGIAPVLVCPEKENRTLFWNQTLSANPQQIIRSKYIVALLALSAVYLISWLISLVVWDSRHAWREEGAIAYWVWWLSGIFTMTAGFFTTWYFRNSFVALLVLLPLALAPAIPGQWASEYLGWSRGHLDTVHLISWVVCIVIVSGVARWAALRAMAPESPRFFELPMAEITSHASTALSSMLPKTEESEWHRVSTISSQTDRWGSRPLHAWASPLASMIWHSVRSAPLTWASLALMVAIGFVSLILVDLHAFKPSSASLGATLNGLLPWGVAIGVLGVSWLGVFAFVGDGNSKQMRFLAERGVSPSAAWWSRHAAAVAWVACLLVVYSVITSGGSIASPLTIGLLLAIIYGISQWTAQTLRQLPASCAAAPFVSAMLTYWLGWAWFITHSPLWWCVMWGCLPWLVTWWQMRQHMENHSQGRIFLVGLGTLIFLVAMPLMAPFYRWYTYPRVPSATIAHWQREYKQRQLEKPLGVSAGPATWGESPQEPHSETQGLFILNSNTVRSLLGLASLEEVNAQYSDGSQSERQSKLVKTIQTLNSQAQLLRKVTEWESQQLADLIEIWLISTLDDDTFKEIRQSAELEGVRQSLADRIGRNAARRRAVLASWNLHQELQSRGASTSSLGGMDLNLLLQDIPSFLRPQYESLIANRLTAAALALLDADNQPDQEAAMQELHQLVALPGLDFNSGPFRSAMRIDNAGHAYYSPMIIGTPALQWRAGWEQLPQRW